MIKLYARTVRTAAALTALCSVAAAALLILDSESGDGEQVSRVVVVGLATALGVIGGLLPAAMAVLHRSGRPRWWSVAAFVAAMTVLAASLSDLVTTNPQTVFSVVGLVVAIGMSVITLFALAEAHSDRPGRDRL